MQVTKIITFSAAHRLTNYEGQCKYLHGHNYKLEVTVQKKQDLMRNGFVIDFKEVKRMLGFVKGIYDHATIVSTEDAQLYNLLISGELKDIKIHAFPGNTTAENMISDMRKLMEEFIVSNNLQITIVKVRLYETETSYAEWGLYKNGI